MTLPANFKWATGKASFMGSLADYLTTQITDESFDFDNPIIPVKLPGFGVIERGLYSLAPVAMDNFLGYKNGTALYGRKNQTLVEISAWDDETEHPNAVGKVRQMRDKIIYCLYNAGRVDDNDVLVLPQIKLYDYSGISKVEKGVIVVDPSDNSINERYMIDPINQNIKIYRILVRFFWYEYL